MAHASATELWPDEAVEILAEIKMASAGKRNASAAKAPEVLDVAVVGGGVAGLYAGWRLLTGTKTSGKGPKSVGLFESSWRLGGRLLSLVPPGIPGTHVEVGGMRFTSSHLMVSGLIKHLGLPVEAFSVYEPQNIAFLRGKMLRSQDLTDATKLPYNLLPDEADPGFLGNVTASAAQRALRMILKKDVPSDEVTDMWGKIAKTAVFEGRHLKDLSMRYLIDRAISIEAFKFNEDSSGYNSILFHWNAVDGFPWNLADYGRSVTYSHVSNGYEHVPLEVARRFEKAGGSIHLEHALVGFDEVKRGGETVIELEINDGRKTKTVLARDLVLAMPKRSLDLLDQRGAVLAPKNTAVHELIGSVTPVPLFKIALCYPFPWWQTIAPVAVPVAGQQPQMMQITQGQSITDLPIRQCYYWAVDPKTQNAVLLVYDDGQDLDFWAALRQLSDDMYPLSAANDSPLDRQSWSRFPAPRLMVEEVHRMLCRMHGVEGRADIPMPYAAAYRDWGEDPFGGGANFWRLHVDSGAVSTAILQPKPPTRVFICGEAYSHQQGWVEGSLQTTELMLEKHFALKPPKWLPPGAVSGSA
jgi:hypothetical protein